MIARFALRLICGMSLMWAVLPRRNVTSGFFRIQMLVVMGLSVLTALTSGMQSNVDAVCPAAVVSVVAGGLAVVGFVGSVMWTLERRTNGERLGFAILATSLILLATASLTHNGIAVWSEWLSPLSQLADAGVLGGTMVGMLLGHWYLTTPSMSIEPLQRINLYLGIASVVRLFVSSVILTMLIMGVFDFADTNSRLASIPKMWLGLRWLAGVFGPIVVSLMVWRILKYRNTQAATGVLFVGVILVFIGDMTAALLLQTTKLPF